MAVTPLLIVVAPAAWFLRALTEHNSKTSLQLLVACLYQGSLSSLKIEKLFAFEAATRSLLPGFPN